MHPFWPWRCESKANVILKQCNALWAQFDLDPDAVLDAATWSLLWDRQICLELVRDAHPDQQFKILQSRLLATEELNKTPFWEHSKLVDMAIERLKHSSASSLPNQMDLVENCILEILRSETDDCLKDLSELGSTEFISKTARIVAPDRLFLDFEGGRMDSDIQTQYWGHWFPGLSNDNQHMSDAINALPGASDVEIPEVVRRLENPSSPVALPGAVTLRRHDVIHILLGRGLLDQDEAFVVGFTMGNSSKYRDADGCVMREALEHWYPEPFRIFGSKLDVFDLGVHAGKNMGIPDISLIPIEELGNATLGQTRRDLKLNMDQLRRYYDQEKAQIPTSVESGRLPISKH
jgi:hypothetical protein